MSNYEEKETYPQVSAPLALIGESTSRLTRSATILGAPEELVTPALRPASTGRHDPRTTAVLLELLHSAQHAIANDGAQADRFITQATVLLTTDLSRRRWEEHSLAPGSGRMRLAPWQTRRVIDFIDSNLTERIRIKDLARVVRLSASHFSKAFRSDFSHSPHAYIVRRRIDRAQEMMMLTDEPLAMVAVACGLSDQSHLTRLFHRLVGVSPAHWRRLRSSPTQ